MSDDVIEFDLDRLDDLTIEQVEWMEEVLGGNLQSHLPTADDPDRPMGRLLRAFAYATVKTTRPDFTLEDAGKLKINVPSDPPTGRRTPPIAKHS